MAPKIIEEFRQVDLGDVRRERRLERIVSQLAKDPSRSLPECFSAAELEGCYRFLNSRGVENAALMEPHVDRTLARCEAHSTILIVHDTTEFRFGGDRSQLPLVHRGQQGHGFLAHVGLAVSADGLREPLGVVAIDTWTRDGTRENESSRWLAQSKLVDSLFGPRSANLIHVEDREGDIFASLASRVSQGTRFVVRAQKQHVVLIENGTQKIPDYLRALPRRAAVEVRLSPRPGSPARKAARLKRGKNAPREGRVANLSIAASNIRFRGPEGKGFIDIKAVHVIEMAPPEGEQAVEWILLTTESVDTDAEMLRIVDFYRARWVIEEYFKALKSGCTYESRQLESLDALERALRIYMVIAWRLLWMRYRAQNAPKVPADVDPDEIKILQAMGFVTSTTPTAVEFLAALARLGGHLKHNGKPGWIVLWRGHRKLELLVMGAQLRSDQS